MIIIPAIDIRRAKCVMLTQGKVEKETIYSNDPVFISKLWQAKGAKRLHLIDLDGAFCGVPQNWQQLLDIRNSFKGMIEVGGGVRSIETIKELVDSGFDRIIISTLVVYHPEIVRKAMTQYKDKIMCAVDVVDGKVVIGGWKEITGICVTEHIKKLEDIGIKEIIITDVLKDGTLEGPNIDGIKEIAQSTSLKIIVSGGVSSVEDINKLKAFEEYGVTGIIIGKALYDETIKFEEVQLK